MGLVSSLTRTFLDLRESCFFDILILSSRERDGNLKCDAYVVF